MRRSILGRVALLGAALGAAVVTVGTGATLSAAGAQSAKADPSQRELLLQQWDDVGGRVVQMAEEFPEDKYEFRPVAGVRTFADVLRHVAFWNTYVAKTARGEKIDPKINELSKSEYASKADVVKALKASLADAMNQLKKEPESLTAKRANLYVSFLEHSGEHYGQLVVYYRLNGIVPPASRGSE